MNRTYAPEPTLRVLVVEDEPDAAEALTMVLELMGHQVRHAADAAGALRAVRAEPADVLLVDIGLPDLSGYALARLLRDEPGARDVPLVALTGFGREADRRTAFAAGFDEHVVKPAAPEQLRDLLARLRRS